MHNPLWIQIICMWATHGNSAAPSDYQTLAESIFQDSCTLALRHPLQRYSGSQIMYLHYHPGSRKVLYCTSSASILVGGSVGLPRRRMPQAVSATRDLPKHRSTTKTLRSAITVDSTTASPSSRPRDAPPIRDGFARGIGTPWQTALARRAGDHLLEKLIWRLLRRNGRNRSLTACKHI